MKKIIITMGGIAQGKSRWIEEGVTRDYQAEAERLVMTAKPYFDESIIRDNDYIKNSPLYPEHKDVLDEPCFGYAYKALIPYEILQKIDYGDFVLFVDSNHVVINNPQPIIDIAMKNGIFVKDHWGVKYMNKQWTLRNTFVRMGCDEERYWSSRHVQANIIGFIKNDFTINFFQEFLTNSLNRDIIFGTGMNDNFLEFKEHRHDQSVFSILVQKYKIPYYENPQQIVPEMDIICIK